MMAKQAFFLFSWEQTQEDTSFLLSRSRCHTRPQGNDTKHADQEVVQFFQQNRTRKAIFEFDKLIRSIYTLRYLCDPQLQRNVHRSQNRIESYHQLRSAIAQVGGKKQLTGKTDIDMQISNQCGRLIANVIIYYNSAILSRLLDKYKTSKNAKAL